MTRLYAEGSADDSRGRFARPWRNLLHQRRHRRLTATLYEHVMQHMLVEQELQPPRQGRPLDVQVGLIDMWIFVRYDPRQRIERQPEPDRRITGDEEQMLGTQKP